MNINHNQEEEKEDDELNHTKLLRVQSYMKILQENQVSKKLLNKSIGKFKDLLRKSFSRGA